MRSVLVLLLWFLQCFPLVAGVPHGRSLVYDKAGLAVKQFLVDNFMHSSVKGEP